MRGQETFLAKFFHSTKPLVVPVYQRNYTWRKENAIYAKFRINGRGVITLY